MYFKDQSLRQKTSLSSHASWFGLKAVTSTGRFWIKSGFT